MYVIVSVAKPVVARHVAPASPNVTAMVLRPICISRLPSDCFRRRTKRLTKAVDLAGNDHGQLESPARGFVSLILRPYAS